MWGIEEVALEHSPQLTGIEFPFLYTARNREGYAKHYALALMIEHMLWGYACKSVRIAPTQAKQALTGTGKAEKEEMVLEASKRVVCKEGWEKLSKLRREAIADAIGIAAAASILTYG